MSETREPRTISEGDFYKLVGLLAVAAEHNRALKVIEHAVAGIVGEESDGYGGFGLASDAVSCGDDPRALLSKLDITVEESPHG